MGKNYQGIGKRIKEARERLSLTQNQLAEIIGVTGSAITNYEKNVSHPKEEVLYKLIDALHVDANFLFQDCIPASDSSMSLEAVEIAKKYSQLPPEGKLAVQDVIRRELRYCGVESETTTASSALAADIKATADFVTKANTVINQPCHSEKK